MKIYCIFFDTTPLFPELFKIAEEKKASLLHQIGNCFTLTTAAEAFTGKKPSDLMQNGLGYLLYEKYIKEDAKKRARVLWPWRKELLMERLAKKGWEIRHHNSFWFTYMMGAETLKTTWTTSPDIKEPENRKLLLENNQASKDFYKREYEQIQKVQSEKQDMFYLMKLDTYHCCVGKNEDSSKVALTRQADYIRQWDFNEPDTIFWFLSDHGSWAGLGAYPEPKHFLKWCLFKDNSRNPITLQYKHIAVGDIFASLAIKLGLPYKPGIGVQALRRGLNPNRIYYVEDGRAEINTARSTVAIACKFINWKDGMPEKLLQVSYFEPKNEFTGMETILDKNGFVKNTYRVEDIDVELQAAVRRRFKWVP